MKEQRRDGYIIYKQEKKESEYILLTISSHLIGTERKKAVSEDQKIMEKEHTPSERIRATPSHKWSGNKIYTIKIEKG